MPKKICVVTGSRAEFGLLKPVLKLLAADTRFQLQLMVTGAHLSDSFGRTEKEIEAEGFRITERVPISLEDDSAIGTARSMSEALAGASGAFARLKPDLVLVLGDRYEIFAVASAALACGLPLAHLCGGDVTAGAFDESLRHAISKLSHLHFVTNADAARRVRSMGEGEVHLVGSTGLDTIRETVFLSRKELESELKVKLVGDILLVTFHPVTRGESGSLAQLRELLAALAAYAGKTTICFTMPNADSGNRELRKEIEAFAANHENTFAFESLGSRRYLSLMKLSKAVVGNSSSGLYEAPFLKVPSVDVGDRQEGRPRAISVLHTAPDRAAIRNALEKALNLDVSGTVSPYGDGYSARRILDILAAADDFRNLLKKRFVEPAARAKRCFVIAEAGVNHNGSEEMAMKLVEAAARAGADAVKFQTFKAEELVTNSAAQADYQKKALGNSHGTQFEMLKALELPLSAYPKLAEKAKSLGIELLSTPFDHGSLEFLVNDLKVPRLKIGSGELTNGPLLARAAASGLPLIVSTGMANIDEIREAVRLVAFVRENPDEVPSRERLKKQSLAAVGGSLTLLHCVTEYPAADADIQLRAMELLSEFGVPVGYSDHSDGILACVLAAGLGAAVVEKHITLDRTLPGPDHAASLEEADFRTMVKEIRRAELLLGEAKKEPGLAESKNKLVARRSLVAGADIKKGDLFNEDNLAVKRPGSGVSPMEYWDWLGKKADRDYKKDEVIQA